MSSDEPKSTNVTNIAQSGKTNLAQTGSGTQIVTGSEKRSPQEKARFFVVGACFSVVAVGLAVWAFALGDLTADQRKILLWILPLASGFACGAFTGGITAKGKGLLPGLAVAATGGFAVWLLTILFLR